MTHAVNTGAPSLSLENYRLLNVKQIQTDTLSHLILSRVSTFSLSSLGDLTYSNECMEASQIYLGNSQDVRLPQVMIAIPFDSLRRQPNSLYGRLVVRSTLRFPIL